MPCGGESSQLMGSTRTAGYPAEKVRLDALTSDLAATEEKQRAAKRAGDTIYDAVFNLDFKNPHTVADDHGDPAALLAKLEQDEEHAASLRNQLRAILAEALLR